MYASPRISVYWYFRIIKLTSPNLNYVIILGAVLLMVGNVFVPSPSTDLSLIAVFCPVSPVTSSSLQTVWLISLLDHHPHCLSSPLSLSLSLSLSHLQISRILLSVGYDICFVVALVKTIRVAYIFCNVTPTKKVLYYSTNSTQTTPSYYINYVPIHPALSINAINCNIPRNCQWNCNSITPTYISWTAWLVPSTIPSFSTPSFENEPFYLRLLLFLIPQKLKDWQLLLMATGIIAVEVIYTIPLLVPIHLNGDTEIVIPSRYYPS